MLMVLGLVTIVRLIKGDDGFYFDFKGFGSTLKMGRGPQHDKGDDAHECQRKEET